MQQQGGYPGGPAPGPPPGAGHARQMSGHGVPMPPHQPHHQRSGSQHSVHSVHSQHSQHGGPPPGHHMPPGPPPPHSRTHTPQHSQHNVFQAVMGARPGQVPQEDVGGPGQVKVYASAYSQIPVFEAMIRNISVMRRMSDSWVNATQILKVAGISKSVRTKILEKQVQTQMHEKVQGGCTCRYDELACLLTFQMASTRVLGFPWNVDVSSPSSTACCSTLHQSSTLCPRPLGPPRCPCAAGARRRRPRRLVRVVERVSCPGRLEARLAA